MYKKRKQKEKRIKLYFSHLFEGVLRSFNCLSYVKKIVLFLFFLSLNHDIKYKLLNQGQFKRETESKFLFHINEFILLN